MIPFNFPSFPCRLLPFCLSQTWETWKNPSIPCRDSSQANTSRGSNDEIKFIFCRGTTLLLLVNLTFIAIQLFIYNANKQFHFHPTVIITIHIYIIIIIWTKYRPMELFVTFLFSPLVINNRKSVWHVILINK